MPNNLNKYIDNITISSLEKGIKLEKDTLYIKYKNKEKVLCYECLDSYGKVVNNTLNLSDSDNKELENLGDSKLNNINFKKTIFKIIDNSEESQKAKQQAYEHMKEFHDEIHKFINNIKKNIVSLKRDSKSKQVFLLQRYLVLIYQLYTERYADENYDCTEYENINQFTYGISLYAEKMASQDLISSSLKKNIIKLCEGINCKVNNVKEFFPVTKDDGFIYNSKQKAKINPYLAQHYNELFKRLSSMKKNKTAIQLANEHSIKGARDIIHKFHSSIDTLTKNMKKNIKSSKDYRKANKIASHLIAIRALYKNIDNYNENSIATFTEKLKDQVSATIKIEPSLKGIGDTILKNCESISKLEFKNFYPLIFKDGSIANPIYYEGAINPYIHEHHRQCKIRHKHFQEKSLISKSRQKSAKIKKSEKIKTKHTRSKNSIAARKKKQLEKIEIARKKAIAAKTKGEALFNNKIKKIQEKNSLKDSGAKQERTAGIKLLISIFHGDIDILIEKISKNNPIRESLFLKIDALYSASNNDMLFDAAKQLQLHINSNPLLKNKLPRVTANIVNDCEKIQDIIEKIKYKTKLFEHSSLLTQHKKECKQRSIYINKRAKEIAKLKEISKTKQLIIKIKNKLAARLKEEVISLKNRGENKYSSDIKNHLDAINKLSVDVTSIKDAVDYLLKNIENIAKIIKTPSIFYKLRCFLKNIVNKIINKIIKIIPKSIKDTFNIREILQTVDFKKSILSARKNLFHLRYSAIKTDMQPLVDKADIPQQICLKSY